MSVTGRACSDQVYRGDGLDSNVPKLFEEKDKTLENKQNQTIDNKFFCLYKSSQKEQKEDYLFKQIVTSKVSLLKMKQQQHDIEFMETSEKNLSPRWDLNPL